jgi:hypothetical protein
VNMYEHLEQADKASIGQLRARAAQAASMPDAPKRIPGIQLATERALKQVAELEQVVAVLRKRLEQGGILLPGPPTGEGGCAAEARSSSQIAQVVDALGAQAAKISRDVRELIDRLDV